MFRRRQIRAIKRAFRKLFKQTWKSATNVSKSLLDWLLRTVLLIGVSKQRQAHSKAGFVLPTVAMLLIVITLVIGAILLRTGSRTNQVIGAREEQIIFNAATPAVERARAKLEYLFLKDKRFPTGAPSDEMLLSMVNNEPISSLTYKLSTDPYTLPDETRLDIDGGGNDPAWYYQVDTDGDGRKETVVYSIFLKRRNDINANVTLESSTDLNKAKSLVVRNGPINTTDVSNPICTSINQSQQNNNNAKQIKSVSDSDWFPVGSGTLRKTFQVDAIVISNKAGTSRTVATLEFQQDRQISRANTGAWFRYDLEIFPGNTFRWNGSMYTAGNLIVGGPTTGGYFHSYLISSPTSCFYDTKFSGASEITIYESPNQNVNDPNNPDFQGQAISGSYQWKNAYGSTSLFDVLKADGSPDTNSGNTTLDKTKDSDNEIKTLPNTAVDPGKLFTADQVQARASDSSNRTSRDTNWDKDAAGGNIGYFRTNKRIYNRAGTVPFIDDSYRADDRYGPKPTYGRNKEVIVSSSQMGQNITGSDATLLTSNTIDPLDTDFRNLGWDGYWERRAWAAGLRLIVGQRLELGNPFGFDSTSDPLLPPATGQTLSHEAQQRRTLRDNLAAVQGTVVYHVNSSVGKDVPIACVATTAHPGTTVTIGNNTNFQLAGNQYTYPGQTTALYSDFFTGLGTNGWEYNVPSFNSNGTLSGGAMQNALTNLANFAGDPDGAFPPKQGGGVHPAPLITPGNSNDLRGSIWGDFSNLRRALNGNSSIADKSYIHSAACTVGMLAYNVNYFVNNYTTYDPANQDLKDLNADIKALLTVTPNPTSPDATPDQILSALSQAAGTNTDKLRRYHLAQFIYMKEQIARDREFAQNDSTLITPSYNVVADDPATTGVDESIKSTKVAQNCTIVKSSNLSSVPSLAKLCAWQSKFPILNAIFPNSFSNSDISAIALQPKSRGQWQLPRQDSPPSTPANQNYFVVTDPDGTKIRTSLGDTGFFNGREMMTVRTLNIDLDLLRRNTVGSDFWLPNSGIVYAFREDAVREDAIARTASGSYTNARNTTTPTDPALVNGVSPKPVDFVADPYRRPYGFRLRNGQNINRGTDNLKGLSFVSDNPVYIQGDFNYHSTDGNSNNLEEFQTPLDLDNWSNFYTRNDLDNRFARASSDTWRPSEIFADAITILSNNFQEGNIASGIRNDDDATRSSTTSGKYSFRAMNGPVGTNYNGPSQGWLTEDGKTIFNPTNPLVPIKVSRNGNPFYCDAVNTATPPACTSTKEFGIAGNAGSYLPFGSDYRPVISQAKETRVNAMIISGIVPSRINQSYGGFHNFPRFIENWSGIKMIISGSFVQLNFSTYATAPFTQIFWEPNPTNTNPDPLPDALEESDPDKPAFINYYGPPARRWGYDVGLQYAPAGAIAQRLVLPPASRSEFYRDLKANDPYICRLRLALNNKLPGQDPVAQQECQ